MMRRIITTLTAFSASVLSVPAALAARPQVDPCAYIGGCTYDANWVSPLIGKLAGLGMTIAAGTAVLFVVVGGAQMVISMGEEGTITKGKMSMVYALIGLGLAMLSQTIVAYVATEFSGLFMSTDPIFTFIRSAITVIVGLFNVVFALMVVYAGYRMTYARGEAENFNKAKSILIWSVVGAIGVNVAAALTKAVINLPL
ncbi:MAG: hypothetical protein WCX61_00225 [Candidatus Peribacteraceae bacterium]